MRNRIDWTKGLLAASAVFAFGTTPMLMGCEDSHNDDMGDVADDIGDAADDAADTIDDAADDAGDAIDDAIDGG